MLGWSDYTTGSRSCCPPPPAWQGPAATLPRHQRDEAGSNKGEELATESAGVDLGERLDAGVAVGGGAGTRLRVVGAAIDEHGGQAGLAGGVELVGHIGEEQDVGRSPRRGEDRTPTLQRGLCWGSFVGPLLPPPDRSCRPPDRSSGPPVHAAFQAVEAPFRTSSAGFGSPGLRFRTSLARFRAVERRFRVCKARMESSGTRNTAFGTRKDGPDLRGPGSGGPALSA